MGNFLTSWGTVSFQIRGLCYIYVCVCMCVCSVIVYSHRGHLQCASDWWSEIEVRFCVTSSLFSRLGGPPQGPPAPHVNPAFFQQGGVPPHQAPPHQGPPPPHGPPHGYGPPPASQVSELFSWCAKCSSYVINWVQCWLLNYGCKEDILKTTLMTE